jgi:hypothetical protein
VEENVGIIMIMITGILQPATSITIFIPMNLVFGLQRKFGGGSEMKDIIFILGILGILFFIACLLCPSIRLVRATELPEVLVTVEDDGVIFVRNREETLVIFCNPKNINKWVLYNRELSAQEIKYLFENERKYPDPLFGESLKGGPCEKR